MKYTIHENNKTSELCLRWIAKDNAKHRRYMQAAKRPEAIAKH